MADCLNYFSLARKAGLLELGEEPVGAAARAGKARLIVVAQDAGAHTVRRAESFVSGTKQLLLRVPYTAAALGGAVGRANLAVAAFTDHALALGFVKALPQVPEQVVTALESGAKRIAQRRQESAAHKRNVKSGHTRKPVQNKQ